MLRRDLNGKIGFLMDQNVMKNGAALHTLRHKRNEAAHEVKHVDWNFFHDAIDVVNEELKHLGFVDDKPEFKLFAERGAVKSSEDAARSGTRNRGGNHPEFKDSVGVVYTTVAKSKDSSVSFVTYIGLAVYD